MAARPLNAKQLEVLQRLALGQSYQEIQDELGVPKSTINRWRAKFNDILSEQSSEIAEQIAQSVKASRFQSAELLGVALSRLGSLLSRSESIDENLAVINTIIKAFTILNPSHNGSVAINNAAPDSEQSRVVVLLPSNGRGDEHVAR